jgi:uncharacterized protein YkwD
VQRSAVVLALLLGSFGCGSSTSGRPPGAVGGDGSSPQDEPLVAPTGPMSLEDAQRFVLTLVNADRKAEGLGPVVWDDVAARAGQRQADDMAKHGFTAHIGTDGSVPELRYTEAGGDGMVMENAGCLADGETRELDPAPKFTAESLRKVQKAFMDEVPPNDGHRRNVLTPWHTGFGVGLAKVKGIDGIACMAQEFVDRYGTMEELPSKAKVGAKVEVKGKIARPAEIAGVGIARIDFPKPRKPKELNKTGGYAIPKPYVTYFPKGFKTPIPVEVSGTDFRIDVPLSDGNKAGIYQISVWAKIPSRKDLTMVSLRTLHVQ